MSDIDQFSKWPSLRFYFGKPKGLKARHRQDDPPNMAAQILRGIRTYGAEYHQRGRSYARTQPTEKKVQRIDEPWNIPEPGGGVVPTRTSRTTLL